MSPTEITGRGKLGLVELAEEGFRLQEADFLREALLGVSCRMRLVGPGSIPLKSEWLAEKAGVLANAYEELGFEEKASYYWRLASREHGYATK